MVAVGAYLGAEFGLLCEYIPFALPMLPWPEVYAMFAGILMNVPVIYFAFSFFSRRRVSPKVE
jgi:hypothetical protein